MRVYASSYRLGGRAEALRSRGSGRALIVMNAADGYPDRLLTYPREAEALRGLGYAPAELDLRDHRGGDPSSLAEVVADAELLWIIGGNAFTLARIATAARLGDALARVPDLIVGGYSAGACLTGVDLAGIELMDDSDERPPGYPAGLPATTLGLVPTRFVPHWGLPSAVAAASALDTADLPYVALRDGEDAFFGDWPPDLTR